MKTLEVFGSARLICIVGIDGSGKTAHARKLLFQMKRSGKKCKYIWFREPYFFSFPLMYLCRTLHFTKRIPLPNKRSQSEHVYNIDPIALVWPWVRFIDLIVWSVWQVYVPIWLGFDVLCDRFIHDVLVDTMIDIDDLKLHKARVGQLMLKLVPSFSTIVMFDINERIASERKNDIPHLEYLVSRRRLYHELSSFLNIPIINTDKPFNSVHEDLLQMMLTCF